MELKSSPRIDISRHVRREEISKRYVRLSKNYNHDIFEESRSQYVLGFRLAPSLSISINIYHIHTYIHRRKSAVIRKILTKFRCIYY